ncbi:MAG TPA: DUF1674 domain-containing protein [Gammaproteobacteria bacterium]|nr:DUF1674 domain-containing protein [Gammaproteobacteria bacterium]
MHGGREQEPREQDGGSVPGHRGEAEPRREPQPEVGGPKGPEPTRYGDWERAGRCIDF